MRRDVTVRMALRAATADAHARVDAVFSRFDLADRADYARFLCAQAAALLPLEAALEAGVAGSLGLDWPARRRGDALRADLAALGTAVPVGADLAPIEQPAAALGTIYVIEGSRLGGSLLKRAVSAEFPASFLSPGPPGAWQGLVQVLETALTADGQVRDAAAAANEAFDRFERAGRSTLRKVA